MAASLALTASGLTLIPGSAQEGGSTFAPVRLPRSGEVPADEQLAHTSAQLRLLWERLSGSRDEDVVEAMHLAATRANLDLIGPAAHAFDGR